MSGGTAGCVRRGCSSLDEVFKLQESVNAPKWTKWEDKQIETSIGDMRQLSNQTMISYSILNNSNEPIEIVPPQIQITGRKATKKKKEGGERHYLGPTGDPGLQVEYNAP